MHAPIVAFEKHLGDEAICVCVNLREVSSALGPQFVVIEACFRAKAAAVRLLRILRGNGVLRILES
jgi:hypothetical protein